MQRTRNITPLICGRWIFEMKLIVIISLCEAAMLVGGCASVHLPNPHEHVVDVHATPWRTDLAADVVIMQVPAIDKISRDHIVTNQSNTMIAFTVMAGGPPDWQVEHVYYQKIGTNERFVILGIPMAHRPFSDLTWVKDRYLVFDRWSSPHYGMHYVVDTSQKRLLLATPFPDQFFLDQQKENSQATTSQIKELDPQR